jgi:hypothetical protein
MSSANNDENALALLALGKDAAVALAEVGNAPTKDKAAPRGKSFTQLEDLMVSKAFVAASCDSIVGASQKGQQFKVTMHRMYLELLQAQTELERSRLHALSSNTISLGEFVATEDLVLEVFDPRTPNSVFDRFKRHVSPRVAKFVGIVATTDMESGWNDENLYQACRAKFIDRYPKFGDSDTIRACIEYLQNKPKWNIFSAAELERERSTMVRKTVRPTGNKKA